MKAWGLVNSWGANRLRYRLLYKAIALGTAMAFFNEAITYGAKRRKLFGRIKSRLNKLFSIPWRDLLFKLTAILLIVTYFNTLLYYDLAGAMSEDILPTPSGKVLHGPAGFNPREFVLPSYLGHAENISLGNFGKTVIHIQDAHCNYAAQKAIYRIIDYLKTEYGITRVNLEGGIGEYDISVFTDVKDEKTRSRVADYFLREGRINGAEFYAINNPDAVRLYGIDSKEWYFKNLNAYREFAPARNGINDGLEALKKVFSAIKEKVYSKELLEFDAHKEKFSADRNDFKGYVSYISGAAESRHIDLGAAFADFSNLRRVLSLEEGIDFKKADNERSALIDDLQKRLSKLEREELVLKAVEFKSGTVTQKDFYSYLKKKADEAGIGLLAYPNFSRYIAYVYLYGSIDNKRLFEEIDIIEKKVMESLYRNDEERELAHLSEYFDTYNKLLDIKATRKDYDFFNRVKSSLNPEEIIDYTVKKCAELGISRADIRDGAQIAACLESITRFYDYANKRDASFIDNTLSGMRGMNQNVSILVTGGFHTEGIKALFREKGISYISVMPNFGETDVPNKYFERLSGRVTPIEEYFLNIINKYGPVKIVAKKYDRDDISAFAADTPLDDGPAPPALRNAVQCMANASNTDTVSQILTANGQTVGELDPSQVEALKAGETGAAMPEAEDKGLNKEVIKPIKNLITSLFKVSEEKCENKRAPMVEELFFGAIPLIIALTISPDSWLYILIISRAIFVLLHPLLNWESPKTSIPIPLAISIVGTLFIATPLMAVFGISIVTVPAGILGFYISHRVLNTYTPLINKALGADFSKGAIARADFQEFTNRIFRNRNILTQLDNHENAAITARVDKLDRVASRILSRFRHELTVEDLKTIKLSIDIHELHVELTGLIAQTYELNDPREDRDIKNRRAEFESLYDMVAGLYAELSDPDAETVIAEKTAYIRQEMHEDAFLLNVIRLRIENRSAITSATTVEQLTELERQMEEFRDKVHELYGEIVALRERLDNSKACPFIKDKTRTKLDNALEALTALIEIPDIPSARSTVAHITRVLAAKQGELIGFFENHGLDVVQENLERADYEAGLPINIGRNFGEYLLSVFNHGASQNPQLSRITNARHIDISGMPANDEYAGERILEELSGRDGNEYIMVTFGRMEEDGGLHYAVVFDTAANIIQRKSSLFASDVETHSFAFVFDFKMFPDLNCVNVQSVYMEEGLRGGGDPIAGALDAFRDTLIVEPGLRDMNVAIWGLGSVPHNDYDRVAVKMRDLFGAQEGTQALLNGQSPGNRQTLRMMFPHQESTFVGSVRFAQNQCFDTVVVSQMAATARDFRRYNRGVIKSIKKPIMSLLGKWVSEDRYDNFIAPFIEELIFTGIPLLISAYSSVPLAASLIAARVMFITLHYEGKLNLLRLIFNRESFKKDLLIPAAISGAVIAMAAFLPIPATHLMVAGILSHSLLNILTPAINKLFGAKFNKGSLAVMSGEEEKALALYRRARQLKKEMAEIPQDSGLATVIASNVKDTLDLTSKLVSGADIIDSDKVLVDERIKAHEKQVEELKEQAPMPEIIGAGDQSSALETPKETKIPLETKAPGAVPLATEKEVNEYFESLKTLLENSFMWRASNPGQHYVLIIQADTKLASQFYSIAKKGFADRVKDEYDFENIHIYIVKNKEDMEKRLEHARGIYSNPENKGKTCGVAFVQDLEMKEIAGNFAKLPEANCKGKPGFLTINTQYPENGYYHVTGLLSTGLAILDHHFNGNRENDDFLVMLLNALTGSNDVTSENLNSFLDGLKDGSIALILPKIDPDEKWLEMEKYIQRDFDLATKL